MCYLHGDPKNNFYPDFMNLEYIRIFKKKTISINFNSFVLLHRLKIKLHYQFIDETTSK